jgi:hypothetical protein
MMPIASARPAGFDMVQSERGQARRTRASARSRGRRERSSLGQVQRVVAATGRAGDGACCGQRYDCIV